MSDRGAIVYFTAPWCAPCKQLLPKVKKAVENAGKVLSVVDIEKNSSTAQAVGIQSVPAILFVDGSLVYPANLPWSKVRELIEENHDNG